MLFPGIKIEPLGIDQFLFWDQFGTLFINIKLIFNHVFYVRHSVLSFIFLTPGLPYHGCAHHLGQGQRAAGPLVTLFPLSPYFYLVGGSLIFKIVSDVIVQGLDQ